MRGFRNPACQLGWQAMPGPSTRLAGSSAQLSAETGQKHRCTRARRGVVARTNDAQEPAPGRGTAFDQVGTPDSGVRIDVAVAADARSILALAGFERGIDRPAIAVAPASGGQDFAHAERFAGDARHAAATPALLDLATHETDQSRVGGAAT